jgi:hypothetical protein
VTEREIFDAALQLGDADSHFLERCVVHVALLKLS